MMVSSLVYFLKFAYKYWEFGSYLCTCVKIREVHN
ncbi:hypothetical protein BVRB_5g098750 [Beta vulgaris subsp. vulgaris]|nr:hypothetical protein BVRB_5g098750 [Beta vulgaris subsp. vulgaris]